MIPTRPRVFLDFSINNVSVGRVVFELFKETTPKTCENFRALCTGEMGLSTLSDRPLYYKNSIVHRSIKNFMIQAGDFTKRNGTGGESIFGSPFPDENLERPLDESGLLCMANKGPDTNGSQFFITLRECSHLNGKHVVFGKVVKGFEDVVRRIAEVPVDDKDRPTVPVVITNCGELELRTRNNQADTKEDKTKRPRSLSDSDGRRRRSRQSPTADSSRARLHKRAKRKKGTDSFRQRDQDVPDKEPVMETEEEYDARLEREEAERHEIKRKQELERITNLYADNVQNKDGVRFKGRGRMKFVDPEIRHRRE